MGTELIEAVDSSSFEEKVAKNNVPVLVKFEAGWCAQCKALHPVLSSLASQYQNKMKFVRVDVEQNPELTERFDISNLPTLVLFKDGQQQGEKLGMMPKAKLIETVENILK